MTRRLLSGKIDTLTGRESVESAKFTDVYKHVAAAILHDESEFAVIDPVLNPPARYAWCYPKSVQQQPR
jgi:hypothetical protein